MWYRGTPPSLEQTKGMPNLMTNYSFGGGGNIFLVIQYFYNGLNDETKEIIDLSAGMCKAFRGKII